MESYGHVYQFSCYIQIISTMELTVISGLPTGNMAISRSATIPTEAKTSCVKMVPSQKSRVDLLVNKLLSIVNLTTLTRAVLWKKPSTSFRLLVNCGYPDRSQL